MVVGDLDGIPYWKKPEEQLPTETRMYYIMYDDPENEKYPINVTALYNVETGKWTFGSGKEVTPLVWSDPYFF